MKWNMDHLFGAATAGSTIYEHDLRTNPHFGSGCSFPCRVAGLSLRQRGRSSDI